MLTALARIACLLAAVLLAFHAAAQDFVPGEVVVGFKPAAEAVRIAAMEAQLGLAIKSDFPHLRARHYRLPGQLKVEDAIPLILQFDFVEYAEPNFLHIRQALPTDPRFGEQWYLRNTGQIVNGLQGVAGEDINWQAARDLFNGTREIVVAVVDTGIALEHPELSGRLWAHPAEAPPGVNGADDDGNGFVDDRAGWDFYDNDALPRDENGHGTLVASLLAAEANNGQGGAGVSPTAKVMALRAGNDFGSIPLTTAISAFTYAAKRGARIINFSAGTTFFSSAMLASIQWLAAKGVLFVTAAGNGGPDGRGDDNDVLPTYPAAYPVANIIAVAALEQDGELASFSNYGASSVHIAAPGTNMLGAAIRTSTHYYENFETGAPGWTQAQLAGSASTLNWGVYVDPQGNRWHADSPGVSGSDVPYQANTNSALVSPPISLAGVTGAQLSARVWHQLERYYDYGYAELSDDGGATWAYLGSVTGHSYGSCPGCGGAAGTALRYDLSRYEGRTVQIRFRLVSDSSLNYAGLFLDDVRIIKVEPFEYDGTQYQFLSGTSFAAPLVAGAASLIWSQRPDLTVSQVKQILLGSARQDARLAGRVSSGGKLDAYAALQTAIAAPASLVMSTELVDFGKQTVGGASTFQTITLSNNGTSTVSSFSFNVGYSSGANAFPMSSDCGVLVPGASCTLSVQFAPAQPGEIEGSIRIETTASGGPHILNVLGVGTASSSSATYAAAGYGPHVDNAASTYLKDGVPYTSNDLPGTTLFNGYVVRQSLDSDDGTIRYYTSDANGIFDYGYYTPSVFIAGGYTSETLTLDPPSKVIDGQFSLGQTFYSSGTATITWAGIGAFALSYTSAYLPAAFESATVPAGTFRALRIDANRRLFGAVEADFVDVTAQESFWVVEGLGSVKSVTTISDGTTTETHNETLLASTLLDATPDSFSFPAVGNASPGAEVTSASITVQGINAGVSIGIAGGQYAVDGGGWTDAPGLVFNGQSVAVRQTASSGYGTTTSATLTIGGMSAAFTVTTLPPASYPVTVVVAGSGTVTSNPAGINCGSVCTANYTQDTIVTLAANPSSGYTFSGWTGACTGTGLCTLTMDAAKNVSASFAQVPDTVAPTIPQGLSATAIGADQINLRWNAADNAGVTLYQVFRDGVLRAIVNAPALRFSDTGLSASTTYSYTVAACDAAGNCSAQSSAASATTLAPGQYAFSPELELGFNLLGNALNLTLDVPSLFGNQDAPTALTPNIVSIWKWNAVQGRWAFYSPQLTVAGIAGYAAPRGYEVLAAIEPGEGYWVNALLPMTLPAQSGTGFNWTGINFPALPTGFNLIAHAGAMTPSLFNTNVSATPPSPGVVPTGNFLTLWAWDALQGKWYFHSPLLEASGGLPAVKSYADSHFYLHFPDYNKQIEVGVGFWVNRP